ncbi:hypothetical protein [Dyadobacter sp. MSC1_007]|jgi:hypothetical protein|uniref:hypothetical protein n=1 Tax=Dyadobacter sp. MSC1_007 TaxID=2909264 RepID=UPI00203055AB|nr:hypothetical protein [Dyadobacter sp. MSC1_007]
MSDILVIQFSKTDKELDSAIKHSFGNQAEFVQSMGFDAGHDIVQVLLPVVPMLAKFLLDYFAVSKKDKGGDSKNMLKRVVISKGGIEIAVEAETIEDVEQILEALRDK